MTTPKVFSTDILVIGCGPAGLMAALEARKRCCQVIAIDKGLVGQESSALGAQRIAATGSWSAGGDSAEKHYQDTLKSGCSINTEGLVYEVVTKVGNIVQELQSIGMPFEWDGIGGAPGHSKPRLLSSKNGAGKMILRTIRAECCRIGVRFMSDYMAVEIVRQQQGNVVGALVYDLVMGEFVLIRSKAVVIATGGIGALYELSSNPALLSGDGIALALRAGAEAMDLEFVQFYPVTALFPRHIRGLNFNCDRFTVEMINSRGERLASKYTGLEQMTRDKLSQLIFAEATEGSTPHGGLFLELTTALKEAYHEKMLSEWLLIMEAEKDLNLNGGKIEVAPSAHYHMGGIRVDRYCRTNIEGLFAAGECTAGVQGANRLAGNGLAEAIALGSIAGRNAGIYATKRQLPSYKENHAEQLIYKSTQFLSDKDGYNPAGMAADVRRLMTANVGVVRNKSGLENTVNALKNLESYKLQVRQGSRWNRTALDAFSVRNMLLVAKTIATAALARRESRGAHFRSDYPHSDDSNMMVNLVAEITSDSTINLKPTRNNSRWAAKW